MYLVPATTVYKEGCKVNKISNNFKRKLFNEKYHVEINIVDNCILYSSSFIGENRLASDFLKDLSDF